MSQRDRGCSARNSTSLQSLGNLQFPQIPHLLLHGTCQSAIQFFPDISIYPSTSCSSNGQNPGKFRCPSGRKPNISKGNFIQFGSDRSDCNQAVCRREVRQFRSIPDIRDRGRRPIPCRQRLQPKIVFNRPQHVVMRVMTVKYLGILLAGWLHHVPEK